MRENLSLLSFWGLVFTVVAVTIFVVVYFYKDKVNKRKDAITVNDLRRRSVEVYLAEKSDAAEDFSKKLRAAADEIERLRAENSVMYWLIVAMNMVVAGLMTLGYHIF